MTTATHARPRERIAEALTAITAAATPWPEAERRLAAMVPASSGLFLGGDGLRPYTSHVADGQVCLTVVRRNDLTDPPLVTAIAGGEYGIPVRTAAGKAEELTVPCTPALRERLDVPSVLLIALGDADRYRGARLSLGVARLASWLRFTHSARVSVIDYALTTDPLMAVAMHLRDNSPQVVGISVNFGQWPLLEELAAHIGTLTRQPVIVLGNILAAFAPGQAAWPFKQAHAAGRLLVATGLGERPLEQLCRRLKTPEKWDAIPGLLRPGKPAHAADGRPVPPALGVIAPPDLVTPDDGLVQAVCRAGGQVSLETSFGCQYGACTFCPRDHKGTGWSRGQDQTVIAVLERLARTGTPRPAVSFVDEEFFGAEGLADPPPPADAFPPGRILAACARLGLRYELYTRLEQLADRRRSREWNHARALLLAGSAPSMRRLFAGVESGSPAQLRRYGKGQTVTQTLDALRVASMLGVPLEFGFITFDPLLTAEELCENIAFLARRDVLCTPFRGTAADKADLAIDYLDGGELRYAREPLYRHVAYMATELEVLARSRYYDHLRRRHPGLLDGTYDHGFARHGTRYQDPRIAKIAGWCRVWTEGMFTTVYEARMTTRTAADKGAVTEAAALITRYRNATFILLVSLAGTLLPEITTLCPRVMPRSRPNWSLSKPDPLRALAATVTGVPVCFDHSLREHRRDR